MFCDTHDETLSKVFVQVMFKKTLAYFGCFVSYFADNPSFIIDGLKKWSVQKFTFNVKWNLIWSLWDDYCD